MGEGIYGGSTLEQRRPTPDTIEKDEAEKLGEAIKLMTIILQETEGGVFTLEDLEDLGDVDKERLDFMVAEEMLFFDRETGEYAVNYDSQHVINIGTNAAPDHETEPRELYN